ncbi:glycosyltransferase family 22 protein [Gigaspora margarita]|uniref:Mannosyltransferase n=1 Tax=Gigaspora margarita TaxID=4874 RepID=A0A8H4A453_GIGMA|nr:glycosyltransferase family 22 protein [Gigaspora margarita]
MPKEQGSIGLRSRAARSSTSTSKDVPETRTIRTNSSKSTKVNASSTWSGKAFIAFLIVRLTAAFFSNIADCDEVFNYWEPTHYLQYGYGMQTWEYSPEYAIRSWAYIKLHAIIGGIFDFVFNHDKIKVFYAIRVTFAVVCALSESMFYIAASSHLGPRVGRYLIIAMLFSAGMWNASTAYLPSTFTMYTTMVAFFYALMPVSTTSGRRVHRTIFWVGLGSLLGWPFSAAVGIPAALEELVLRNALKKPFERIRRLILGVTTSLCIILIPLALADYYFYKTFHIVPWNIIAYNVFGGKDRGPDIYGTEPWHFYIINGLLNFNILFIMALISLPGLLVTVLVDNQRISSSSTAGSVYAYSYLSFRLVPFYAWLFIFTAQPHKEERFLFVIYPLVCLNAAIAIFLVRGWVDKFLLALSKNIPYGINRRCYLKLFTITIFLISGVTSISRVFALYFHYNAPMSIYRHFYYVEIPQQVENHKFQMNLNNPINLCIGKEWYRFPSHYFLPDGVRLRFLKSDFNGQLPKYFLEDMQIDPGSGKMNYKHDGTWMIQDGFNDVNMEEMDRYVDIEQCDYIIDLEMNHTQVSTNEPRYVTQTEKWNEVICEPFLDVANSDRFSRAFYLPPQLWQKVKIMISYLPVQMMNNNAAVNNLGSLKWGDYCLLRKRRFYKTR